MQSASQNMTQRALSSVSEEIERRNRILSMKKEQDGVFDSDRVSLRGVEGHKSSSPGRCATLSVQTACSRGFLGLGWGETVGSGWWGEGSNVRLWPESVSVQLELQS